jgi:hypothetical protein
LHSQRKGVRLRRAASSGGRLGPDVEAAGDGALHFVLQP